MPTDAVLICRAGGISLALPLEQVMGVSPLNPVTPLPFCSPVVEGLVLAMGLAVVQVSVASALDLPPAPGGVLAIVRRGDDVRALRLEAVVAMVELEVEPEAPGAGAVEGAAAGEATPWSAVSVAWRGEAVPVLDIGTVWAAADLPDLGAAGSGPPAPLPLTGRAHDGNGGTPEAAVDQDAHLLLDVGGEPYSIPTDSVVELLPVGAVRPVPGAPSWVAGLVDRRGAPVLAIDMRVLLGHAAPGAGRLALLIERAGMGVVALLIDQALAISYVDRADTHEVREAVAGVTRYVVTGEGRIVGVIDAEALLEQVVDRLAGFVPHGAEATPAAASPVAAPSASSASEPVAAGSKVLVVRVGSDLFAVPLDRVERIVPAVTLSRLPFDGHGFDGMIDIGEHPVPVLDLRGGAERSAEPHPPCALIRLEGATAGLVVDQVMQIESPPQDSIDAVAADDGLPISGVFDVRGRIVAMLMLDRLLPILS